MTQISKATFNTTWADSAGTFADNTSRLISEGDLRQFAEDIKDSVPFNLDASIAQIQTVKVTISSAEILTANSSPITLIPAQGAGTVIQFLTCLLFLDYNSIPYATNTIVNFTLGSRTLSIVDILGQTSDIYFDRPSSTVSIDTVNTSNQPLKLTVATGNPTAGNSPLYVYLTYRVITL